MSAVPHHPNRAFRYHDFIMVAFVTVLLYSNLIDAFEAAQVTLPVLGSITFGTGVLFFLISHIFGDIPAKVYSYGRDRCVVWTGFTALIFVLFMSLVVLALPVAPFVAGYQRSLNDVFGNTPCIVVRLLIAFRCDSSANSCTLAKMKIAAEGKWLWTHIVGLTMMSEAADSSLFCVIASCDIWPHERVLHVVIAQYVLKAGWGTIATPLAYRIAAFLKRAKDENYYDRDINFTPFRPKV